MFTGTAELIESAKLLQPPIGCSSRTTELGATYLRIHYSADPKKDAQWAKAERAKSPDKEWRREMEMDETVYDGEPVWPEYDDAWHCLLGSHPLGLIQNSIYVGGWDGALHPAFVLLQITPFPHQVHAILEVIPPAPEPMDAFAPRVMKEIVARVPGMWHAIKHYGDESINQRNAATGETSQARARKHGFNIRLVHNELSPRLGSVTWFLQRNISPQEPKFIVDGHHCPVLRQALGGAYRYKESPQGEGSGVGRIFGEPLKDGYSHVADALQYACVPTMKELVQIETERSRYAG